MDGEGGRPLGAQEPYLESNGVFCLTQELEDLRQLIRHPGYLRWKQQQLDALNTDMVSWMRRAADDTNDLLALQKLRQVSAAISAVEKVFAYPEERVRHLEELQTREHLPATYSRRGAL